MKLKRNYLFGTTVLAGIVAIAAPAWAQSEVSQEAGATQVDEIVVTGSRIRRDPTTSPTPLIQVQREELLTTGQNTVIDYLSQIPALSNSQVPSDNTGSVLNAGGLAIANLRALGNARTLTLVDGRRHVGSQQGTLSVSVNTIPRLLIQNIEIITGGASSVYGADAVAGVVNFQLRKDFEGLEIDTNYAQITQKGRNEQYRVSALIGKNFLDDRLNLYGFGEYERVPQVESMDLDWIARGNSLVGVDADPITPSIGPAIDGVFDNLLFSGLYRLDRPRWGSTTLANAQQPSATTNPNVPQANCTGVTAAACYSVDPAKTWWFDGNSARLANFGQRIGNVGSSRPLNIGGDGEPIGLFSQDDRLPQTDAYRFQVGSNFKITDQISAYAEAKYTREDTYAVGQPTFFDFYLSDTLFQNDRQAPITFLSSGAPSNQNHAIRVSDNAFIPAALKAAIAGNTVTNYGAPTLNSPGQPGVPTAAPWARHTMFGPNRDQTNERELQRYVLGFTGNHGDIGFVKNVSWDLGYTYGRMDNLNNERGVDVQRFVFAADSVVDTLGVVNGRAGEIVCRVKLINAANPAQTNAQTGAGGIRDYSSRAGQTAGTYSDVRARAEGRDAINECVPLNIFGKGNQSAEALAYVDASINVRQRNEQHDAVGSVSGQLWDFWGAGPLGVAIGGEWRKEFTQGIGRNADTGDRQLFLNTGPDFAPVSYESKEFFSEVSLPLFRDSVLGEYAELSGSYRYSDYSNVGNVDIYGVNLVYRPVRDISFKTSFNTSVRVPNLGELYSPYTQTFANGFVDPCSTASINAASNAEFRANRIANCTALASGKNLAYDFAGATATTDDDYTPLYTSGIPGVNGGNPFLQPEESESFTFSTVFQPRFAPRLSVVLDYYEIEISNVIASVSAQTAANTCVNGPSLNAAACSTIFRETPAVATPGNNIERSEGFKVGSAGQFGGFIQGSINYAKRTARGLDFTANYSLDTREMFGWNLGTFTNSLRGSWLIEQKQFNNIANPGDFTEFASTLQTGGSFPRVRFANTLSWMPNDTWALTWTTDFQTSQDIFQYRTQIANIDERPIEYLRTGNFVRNDFSVRYNVRDNLTLRANVTNVFDAEPMPWLGTTLYSNFDPYGRRFNVSLNYRPW